MSASDGTLLSTYCAYEGGALGVKSVSWGGANGELLAVGSFDQVGFIAWSCHQNFGSAVVLFNTARLRLVRVLECSLLMLTAA